MKIKLEIYSTEELNNFFTNLNDFFDISVKTFLELEESFDKKNLSVVFFR